MIMKCKQNNAPDVKKDSPSQTFLNVKDRRTASTTTVRHASDISCVSLTSGIKKREERKLRSGGKTTKNVIKRIGDVVTKSKNTQRTTRTKRGDNIYSELVSLPKGTTTYFVNKTDLVPFAKRIRPTSVYLLTTIMPVALTAKPVASAFAACYAHGAISLSVILRITSLSLSQLSNILRGVNQDIIWDAK